MKDAIAKAEQLADLGGVRLGHPTTYISEGRGYVPYPMVFMERTMDLPAPTEQHPTIISPGEVELSLTIQVVFEIA